MAQLSTKPYPFPAFDWKDLDGSIARSRAFWKGVDAAEAALPEGEIVGVRVSLSVADGSAEYIVVKESPLTLSHVPDGDAYRAHPALIRGLRKADIISMKRLKEFKTLFEKKVA